MVNVKCNFYNFKGFYVVTKDSLISFLFGWVFTDQPFTWVDLVKIAYVLTICINSLPGSEFKAKSSIISVVSF